MLKKKQILHAFRLLIMVIVGGIMLGTVLAFLGVGKAIDIRVTDRMQRDSSEITIHLNDRLESYWDLLYDVRAYALNNNDKGFNESTWKGYIESKNTFSRYPGVAGISVARYIPPTSLAAAQAQLNREFPGNEPIRPSIQTEGYAVVVRVAANSPEQTARKSYNLFTEPTRKWTLENAAKNKQPQMSPTLTLTNGEDGLVMSLPIYTDDSDQPFGFVTLIFSREELFKALFRSTDPSFGFLVQDISDPNNKQDLHRSKNFDNGDMRKTETLSIGNRTWNVDYSVAKTHYTEGVYGIIPYFVLIVGTAISLSALIIAGLLMRSTSE